MNLFSRSLTAVILIGIAGSTSTIPNALPRPTRETKRVTLLNWMDDVDFPPAKESEFFEITVPTPRSCGDQSIVLHGFLICQYLGKRVYFTDDASSFILDGNQSEETKIRKIDFSQYVDRVLLSQDAYLDSRSIGFCIEMGHRCSLGRNSLNLFPAMRDMILARWCLQSENTDAADRLWARATTTMPKLAPEMSVEELFRMYLSAFLLDRAVASMADPATRRADCLMRLEWLGTTWTGSEYGEMAKQLCCELKEAMRIEQVLDKELNGIDRGYMNADQLVRQLIDQEFAGGDIHTGFVPFERTGVVSPVSEILRQSNLTRDVLSKYVDSNAPTRLVDCRPNELPRLRWVKLGTVTQSLLDQITANSNANR